MTDNSLHTAKLPRSFEAIIEILVKMLGLVIVYLIFEFIGLRLIGDEFQKDTLLSLVVLPAIYILKDSYTILEPYFINITLSENKVTVNSGILTKRLDSLDLKTVENIELITTPAGRFYNFSTLNIYAYGSWVELPFVKFPNEIKKKIEDAINEIREGKN